MRSDVTTISNILKQQAEDYWTEKRAMNMNLTLTWGPDDDTLVAADEHGEILRVKVRRDWHSDQKRIFVGRLVEALDAISGTPVRNIDVKG